MIYLFFSPTGRAFVEAVNVEAAQQCVTEQMHLHSAYETWPGALAGLDHLQGTISDVKVFLQQLPPEEISKQHKKSIG